MSDERREVGEEGRGLVLTNTLHLKHHEYIDQKIKKEKDQAAFWGSMKKDLIRAIVMAAVGFAALAMLHGFSGALDHYIGTERPRQAQVHPPTPTSP